MISHINFAVEKESRDFKYILTYLKESKRSYQIIIKIIY